MKIEELPSPLKLDLACGNNKQEGYLGVDIVDMPSVDIVCDLDKYQWPFKDNSVDAVYVSHYLEHTKDLIAFMNELYRVMKKGAIAEMVGPYYTSIRCWQDPTHIRALSEGTSLYWSKGWREREKLEHYPLKCDFDVAYIHAINEGWSNIWPYMDEVSRDYAVRHYWNVVDDIVFRITKK